MDLTRLYNLTTTDLQAQAERLGIADPHALSRAQLIRAIRDQNEIPAEPRGFLGKVFGIARRAIEDKAPPPRPQLQPQPQPRVAMTPESKLAMSATRPKGAPTGVFSGQTAATTSGLYEEPFPTQTMARILAQQGHYKRSLAIYGSLLQERPLDEALQREAEETRKNARTARLERNPSSQ